MLVLLLVVSAILTAQRALVESGFVCTVCLVSIIALIESLLSECRLGGANGLMLSMVTLSLFAFLQTIRLSSSTQIRRSKS